MKMKVLIASAALGMALSTTAMAASISVIPPNNRCTLYARDLNWDIMLMKGDANADSASAALAQGQDECSKGKYDDGIATITGAVKSLGLPVNEH
jgi:hypothetical protein